jgi:hypothetical protein
MLQMTSQLTLLSLLWTFQHLGFEVHISSPLTKKSHFNRLCRDTQKRYFRPLENKIKFRVLTIVVKNVLVLTKYFLSFWHPSRFFLFFLAHI